MANYKGKPDINNGGRLTRLARTGKAPGQRRREQLLEQVGLTVSGKVANPDGTRMSYEDLDKATIATYKAATGATESSEEEGGGTLEGITDNPVLNEYQLRAAAREWCIKQAGLELINLRDRPPVTADKFDSYCRMMEEGYNGYEIMRLLEMSNGGLWNFMDNDVTGEAKKRYEKARENYTHARMVRLYDEIAREPDPQRARLLADTVKWELSKVLPKFYGERPPEQAAGAGVTFQINLAGALKSDNTVTIEAVPESSKAIEHRQHDAD